jgi:hypothetical protein
MSIKEGNGTAAQSVKAHLINRFNSTKLSYPELASVLAMPRISHIGSASAEGMRLGLQPPCKSAAHRTEFDKYFATDNVKVHGKSKMKRAFCEPGNISFCLPIELRAYFGGLDGGGADGESGEVTISRSPDNGGDVTCTAKLALVHDSALGAHYPGDLKGAVSNMMVEVLTKIGAKIKGKRAVDSIVKAAREGATAIDGTLIRDGKVTDYPDALQAGQHISYWWCEVDGWLARCVSKALTKTIRKNTIWWMVGVVFD